MGVLPDTSNAWTRIEINGLNYRYTIDKDPNADAQVHVRNQNANGSGYIFSETDNWDGQPGGTIQRFFRFGYSDSSRWGDGEIALEGEGSINGAIVTYNYKMTVDQFLLRCSISPLYDTQCPGFVDALLEYLKNLEYLSPEDPYYDQWVQAQLEKEVELEDQAKQKEEKQEEDLERRLGGRNSIDAMVDSKQQDEIMAQLSQLPNFDSYYQAEIQGGEYEETLQLEDKEIPDNKRALNNLASDAKHKAMVRSQYDREQ